VTGAVSVQRIHNLSAGGGDGVWLAVNGSNGSPDRAAETTRAEGPDRRRQREDGGREAGDRVLLRGGAAGDRPRVVFRPERIEFAYHQETSTVVVRVLDVRTGEVVKEIPPEEYLSMVARTRAAVDRFMARAQEESAGSVVDRRV